MQQGHKLQGFQVRLEFRAEAFNLKVHPETPINTQANINTSSEQAGVLLLTARWPLKANTPASAAGFQQQSLKSAGQRALGSTGGTICPVAPGIIPIALATRSMVTFRPFRKQIMASYLNKQDTTRGEPYVPHEVMSTRLLLCFAKEPWGSSASCWPWDSSASCRPWGTSSWPHMA